MDAGLLAVKRLDAAKGRLSARFDKDSRIQIATALFEDALDLCGSATHLKWWVISDDRAVIQRADAAGFETMRDEGTGLNDAVISAARALTDLGATSLVVLPSDIPLATAEDLLDISDTGGLSDVVVVPSEGDGGTNALFLGPPEVITPRFGPGSLALHVRTAEAARLRCSVLPLERLQLDLDNPEDVDRYLEIAPAATSRTARVLRSLTA